MIKKIIHSFTVNHKGKKYFTVARLGSYHLNQVIVSITSNGTNWNQVPPDGRQWGDCIISCQRCLIRIMGKDQTNSKLMVIIQNNWLETLEVSRSLKIRKDWRTVKDWRTLKKHDSIVTYHSRPGPIVLKYIVGTIDKTWMRSEN